MTLIRSRFGPITRLVASWRKRITSIPVVAAATFLTLAVLPSVRGADGDLDTTFGVSGSRSVNIGGSDNVYGSYLQADGKMLVVGGGRPVSTEDFSLVRFNADGSVDTGFGTNGIYSLEITSSAADRATGVGVQSDGKIIVGGYTRFASGNDNFAIIRLTTAGVLDTTFGINGIVQIDFAGRTDRAACLKVLANDRIVIAGWGSVDGINLNFALARLTANGSSDASFGTDGKVMIDIGNSEDNGKAIAIQDDGKILLGGHSASSGGNYQLTLLRLTTAGALDTTFDTDGVVAFNFPGSTNDSITAMELQTDGKIVVAGYSTLGDAFIARLTSVGALDTTFNTTGYHLIDLGSSSDQFLALALQTGGKIIAGGQYVNGSATDSALVRVSSAGALDTTFGTNGKKLISLASNSDKIVGLGFQASGKLVAAIQTATASGFEDFGVARFEIALSNNVPTDIALSSSTVNQSGGIIAVVGTLSTTDADALDTHTYSFASGTGDTNNASFNISSATLRANNSAALSAGPYSVRIQTSDGNGGTYAKAFALTVVDDVGPTVASVTAPASGTRVAGGNLDFIINFNEAVTINTTGGVPALSLTIGATARSAGYVSGSGTTALLFRYTVQAGDADSDGIAVDALVANGGTLRDSASNNAVLTLNNVGSTAAVTVDAVAPTVVSVTRLSPSGQHVASSSATFRVTYSEAVTNVGTANFAVAAVGGSSIVGTVTDVSGSGSTRNVTVSITSGAGEFRLNVVD